MCSFDKINSVFTKDSGEYSTLMNCYHNTGYVELNITSGFWVCQKRFSQGRLAWWPTDKTQTVTLRASELLILLAQGNPIKAGIPSDWRSVTYAANDNAVNVS